MAHSRPLEKISETGHSGCNIPTALYNEIRMIASSSSVFYEASSRDGCGN